VNGVGTKKWRNLAQYSRSLRADNLKDETEAGRAIRKHQPAGTTLPTTQGIFVFICQGKFLVSIGINRQS
jgi:hypothetical protein